MIKKQIAERLGSGNKMQVSMHEYGMSTHNLSKIRRTSMSIGTLVPMGCWIILPQDKGKMRLDSLMTSNPLLYQLYGTMKFQIDVFTARMALYQPKMGLNLMDMGLDVSDIKFPIMKLEADAIDWTRNPSWQQINPSSALAYTGIVGLGQDALGGNQVNRNFHAMWKLMYTHIYKEYYANKQEGIGVVIHNEAGVHTVTGMYNNNEDKIPQLGQAADPRVLDGKLDIEVGNSDFPTTQPNQIGLIIDGEYYRLEEVYGNIEIIGSTNLVIRAMYLDSKFNGKELQFWYYTDEQLNKEPKLRTFDLKNVDKMQMQILASVEDEFPFEITDESLEPYNLDLKKEGTVWSKMVNQEGLFIKTYQSDIFNNWLNSEWIDNIKNRSTVQVDEEGFTIDSLLIMQKTWNYLNRIAVADGTLDGWREVTYGRKSSSKSLKPIYEGGLSKEIIFDTIISTAGTAQEPLASLASRGMFGNKHKGGVVEISAEEESLLMVIASITPRVVYNQGNRWDVNLKTLDDLHKPEFDRIGFQNLVTDTMGYWETQCDSTGDILITQSAGKQPAWMWYKTDYDDALGNMALEESYKVLGRNYGWDKDAKNISDLTTYIDPTKFQEVFAINSLDAMNFDIQVGMDFELRRVMSAEAMPNM